MQSILTLAPPRYSTDRYPRPPDRARGRGPNVALTRISNSITARRVIHDRTPRPRTGLRYVQSDPRSGRLRRGALMSHVQRYSTTALSFFKNTKTVIRYTLLYVDHLRLRAADSRSIISYCGHAPTRTYLHRTLDRPARALTGRPAAPALPSYRRGTCWLPSCSWRETWYHRVEGVVSL